ncbi:transposon ty3-I gag-pol polyprotein [Tanacetum coccineum]
MVVVDQFSKMAHFIACHTTYDVVLIANLYFKEIVHLHGVPKTMVSDQDVKFLSHFWMTLWRKLGTKLKFSTSSHLQTDGQTEVTNSTLGSLLRALITTNMKQWEELLPRAEFAYNRAPNNTTGISHFIAVYGINPPTPLDLAVLDTSTTVLNTSTKFSQEAYDLANDIKAIHPRIHDKITKNNELLKYKRDKGIKHVLFQPGDLVWLHFRKERFPSKCCSKLSPRSDGPFKVLAKVLDNAYKIDLPGNCGVSATFNVADLQPYFDPDELIPSLRPNFFEDGEGDRKAPIHNPSSSIPTQIRNGSLWPS